MAEICDEHNHQFFMFCLKEYKLVCPMCTAYFHKAHQTWDFDTTIQTLRTDLEFALHTVKQLKKQVHEAANIIEENSSRVKEWIKQLKVDEDDNIPDWIQGSAFADAPMGEAKEEMGEAEGPIDELG